MVRKCQTVISCSVRYVGVVNINSGGGGIHNTIYILTKNTLGVKKVAAKN